MEAIAQGITTLKATEEEKNPKPKENMIAFTDLQQFTQEEAVKWLEVEAENAREIGRDCDTRGVGGAYLAQVRADACMTLQKKISKAKGKKIWDLNEELGEIQNRRLIKEGLLALSEPNTGTFQGIKGSKE